MAARALKERVEILEQKVGDLQVLPERVAAVESQILQLRSEMRGEFSAIREHLEQHDRKFDAVDQRFDAVDRRFEGIDQRFEESNRTMRVLHEEVLTRLKERDDERGRLMRVLHEEVLTRIALLQEDRRRKKR
jgi:chromosome segregation ATPase